MMIDYYQPKIDFVLCGSGYSAYYFSGAFHFLWKVWSKRPFNRVSGSSSGGFSSALLSAELKPSHLSPLFKNIPLFFDTLINPFKSKSQTIDYLRGQLDRLLPEDAHILLSGRYGSSLSQVWPIDSLFVSNFESREELIESTIAGCFIPICMGVSFPNYKNKWYIDGAYTDNEPRFELTDREKALGYKIANVSPFGSQFYDVAPRDEGYFAPFSWKAMGAWYLVNTRNFKRFLRAFGLISPDYDRFFLEGFMDMKRYILEDRDIIRCMQCHYQNFQPATACLSCHLLWLKADNLEAFPYEQKE